MRVVLNDAPLSHRPHILFEPIYENLDILVALLDPIFGQFIDEHDNCVMEDHDHKAESEINSLVLQQASQMSEFFRKEKERQGYFINILSKFDIDVVPGSIGSFTNNREMCIQLYPYMLLKVKSSIGSKDAKPYCQEVPYYIGRTSDKVKKEINLMGTFFNFPCLIVTLYGVFLLPAHFYMSLRKNAMKNFRKCLKSSGICSLLIHILAASRAQMGRQTSSISKLWIRLLFIVKREEGKQLCIKFMQTYSHTVHEQCAVWEIAPPLREFCNDIPGEWMMVVMDFLENYDSSSITSLVGNKGD
ncbi:hypothetical protein EV363DRAFT_1299909 [Boletus edulis]|nr:hypothetical protein EV363DRAFT_1299909 [Boletus edulis]